MTTKILTKSEIAELLHVSTRTLEKWVKAGIMPAPRAIGRRVYWVAAEFDQWLNRKLCPAPRRGRPRTQHGQAVSEC